MKAKSCRDFLGSSLDSTLPFLVSEAGGRMYREECCFYGGGGGGNRGIPFGTVFDPFCLIPPMKLMLKGSKRGTDRYPRCLPVPNRAPVNGTVLEHE